MPFLYWVDIVGIQFIACPNSFAGTSIRAMEEEVSKKIDFYVNMLQESAEKCQDQGVIYSVNINNHIVHNMERRCITMNMESMKLM